MARRTSLRTTPLDSVNRVFEMGRHKEQERCERVHKGLCSCPGKLVRTELKIEPRSGGKPTTLPAAFFVVGRQVSMITESLWRITLPRRDVLVVKRWPPKLVPASPFAGEVASEDGAATRAVAFKGATLWIAPDDVAARPAVLDLASKGADTPVRILNSDVTSQGNSFGSFPVGSLEFGSVGITYFLGKNA